MQRGEFLSDGDRVALSGFPAVVDHDDLGRCFVLGPADLDLVWAREGAAARLVGGLQLGALRLLGFVPDDVTLAPDPVVEFVARQVAADRGDLDGYSRRKMTRWAHVSSVERHLGFRRAGSSEMKELEGWLDERALEHDRPVTLFAMACDHLMGEEVIRPGVTTVERMVVAARSRGWIETYRRLEPQLGVGRRLALDSLLVVDVELGMSPLAWLQQIPAGRVPAQIRAVLEMRGRLLDAGAAGLDVSMVNPNRVRHLAGLGRRMGAQSLARMSAERRYPILVATVVEGLASRSDLALDLFDTALGGLERGARRAVETESKDAAAAAGDT